MLVIDGNFADTDDMIWLGGFKKAKCRGVILTVGGILSHGMLVTKEKFGKVFSQYQDKFVLTGVDDAEKLRDGQQIEIRIQGDTATILEK